MRAWLLLLFLAMWSAPLAATADDRLLIDMVQNNPGDAVAWQQTKYRDPTVLKKLGFSGQTTTGEMSGTQAVDFRTLGDFFPSGTADRAWLDTYRRGVHNFVNRAKAADLKAYFFVDLLVFPTAVLKAFPNATSAGKVLWNNATKQLVKVLIDETFATFPGCGGWIIREGETYVYDTPYHRGNSPCTHCGQDLWVDFISFLRDEVCVRHNRSLFVRSWDNWPSDKAYYVSMSDQIETHPQLFFSIKHSPGDFTRPAGWNPQLGVGKHHQIVEVELQREYEGKGAFPNYVMDGVIDGFPEMATKVGLNSIVNSTQLKGLWTWTRGGGWWGPYIHGREEWIDLHVQVLSRWWLSKGVKTEPDCFEEACGSVLTGCSGKRCCNALRNMTALGADSTLHGMWGTVKTSAGDWTRDDRIGGMDRTSGHFRSLGSDERLWSASLAEKQRAKNNWAQAIATFETDIAPVLSDPAQAAFVASSLQYGQHLFTIIDAAWRVMAQGYRKDHGLQWDAKTLKQAIADYDVTFGAYHAFGLAEPYAPSLYHDYYLCLGPQCTGALSPNPRASGIGNTVDKYRAASPSPPPTPPEGCTTIDGFKCIPGVYCSDSGSSVMTDYSHAGSESLASCKELCEQDSKCTCFIHTGEPSAGFDACKTVSKAVTGSYKTARGYNAYLRQARNFV